MQLPGRGFAWPDTGTMDSLVDAAVDLRRDICFDDPAIGVDWGEVKRELLSQKDTTSPLPEESDCIFVYGEI